MPLLDALSAALAPAGLNTLGVVHLPTYEAGVGPERTVRALFPPARSVVVIGSGGGALWEAFVEDLRRDPSGLTDHEHPLDAFVRRAVGPADEVLAAVPHRWFWCGADADVHLDFRLLAHAAGLGARSRMGLLIHERWGLWLGLRAAIFLAADLPPAEPGGPALCDGCPAPCVSACPGGAFVRGAWDVDACASWKSASDACERSCVSREACPVGAENRYPAAEIAYHNHRESGRRLLREHLGVTDDPFEGTGPYWGTWRSRVDVKG